MLLLFLGLFCLSFGLTGWIRHRAMKDQMYDLPNERSSHTEPVPRGGGAAFVMTFLVGLTALSYWIADAAFMKALFCMAFGLGGIGWLDDRFSLPVSVRFAVHAASAMGALYFIGFFSRSDGLIITLSFLYLVSLINIFNFLDGIDGYAVMESCFVAMTLGGLCLLAGESVLALMLLVFIVSILGFGMWNFPKAKIFMGDVGSGFLGGVLGLFTLYAGVDHPPLLCSSLILMGIFIVDAAMTLWIRVIHKEKFWQAHRQHAYQHLAQALGSHVKVTSGALVLNVVWFLPLAVIAFLHPQFSPAALLLAYVPLFVIVKWLGAGQKTG